MWCSALWCMRCRIHRYVAAPPLSQPASADTHTDNLGVLLWKENTWVCHPTGPRLAPPLLWAGSRMGIRKGFTPSLTCLNCYLLLVIWHFFLERQNFSALGRRLVVSLPLSLQLPNLFSTGGSSCIREAKESLSLWYFLCTLCGSYNVPYCKPAAVPLVSPLLLTKNNIGNCLDQDNGVQGPRLKLEIQGNPSLYLAVRPSSSKLSAHP